MHVIVLGFGVAVGAPELLRGRTVAQRIVLIALQLCRAGVGRRPRVHKILDPKVARRPLRVYSVDMMDSDITQHLFMQS